MDINPIRPAPLPGPIRREDDRRRRPRAEREEVPADDTERPSPPDNSNVDTYA